MLKKILFPAGNTEHSMETLKYVKDFAKKYNAEVIVLNVYEEPNIYTLEYEEFLKQGSSNFLDEIKIEFDGVPVRTIMYKGHIGKGIVDVVETEKCDFIIMGKHGLTSKKGFLIGSTANYVIHHTKCPVFLV